MNLTSVEGNVAGVNNIWDTVKGFPQKIVGMVNNFFVDMTGTSKYAPFLIALLLMFLFRRKYNEGWFVSILMGLIFFFALKGVGVGG